MPSRPRRSTKPRPRSEIEIEAATKTDAEKAVKRATAAEAQLVAPRRTAVDAEIRAAASSWADPTDAPRYLDERDRYLGQDGAVDTAAISADLAAVLTQRPHLGPRRRATPSRSGHLAGAAVGRAVRGRRADPQGRSPRRLSHRDLAEA